MAESIRVETQRNLVQIGKKRPQPEAGKKQIEGEPKNEDENAIEPEKQPKEQSPPKKKRRLIKEESSDEEIYF